MTKRLKIETEVDTLEYLTLLSDNFSIICLSDEYSDMTLIVEGEKIPVHKVILASRCQYFKTLFYGSFQESNQNEIVLNNVQLKAFKILLNYIYSGKINLKTLKEDIQVTLDILILVNQYGFTEIEFKIFDILKSLLSANNVFDILPNVNALDYAVKACYSFLDKYASQMLTHKSFLTTSQSCLVNVLKRDSFFAPETEILKGVLNWRNVNNDEGDEILKCVRFSLMSVNDLQLVIKSANININSDVLFNVLFKESDRNSTTYRGQLLLNEDVCLASSGSKAIQGRNVNALLDGDASSSKAPELYTSHKIESNKENLGIIVKLGTPAIINHIQMYMWSKCMYMYFIEVSMNLKDWSRIIDYTSYWCKSWQDLYFDQRTVQYIKVVGTKTVSENNNYGNHFRLIDIKAYYTEKIPKMINDIILPHYSVACFSRAKKGIGSDTYFDSSTRSIFYCAKNRFCVQFAQPYVLSNLRFLLSNSEDKIYGCILEIKKIGAEGWDEVSDKIHTKCEKWQIIHFPQRVVTSLKISDFVDGNVQFKEFECPS